MQCRVVAEVQCPASIFLTHVLVLMFVHVSVYALSPPPPITIPPSPTPLPSLSLSVCRLCCLCLSLCLSLRGAGGHRLMSRERLELWPKASTALNCRARDKLPRPQTYTQLPVLDYYKERGQHHRRRGAAAEPCPLAPQQACWAPGALPGSASSSPPKRQPPRPFQLQVPVLQQR
jgi:hypothetical protein